jgi:hypothetical protein
MERRERIGHLLGSAETSIALAIRFFSDHRDDEKTREYVKETRRRLKQAIEAIDGVD